MISPQTLALLQQWMPPLLAAAGHTLRLAALSYALAAVLGLFVALGVMARSTPLRRCCRVYIELIRGTPTLTLLFLTYFGLASAGVVIPGFAAAVLALALHYAAYMAETYRAGIGAVDRGQYDSARAIGMTRVMTMRLIILPQSVRVILPPMTNSAISVLKDTSVASLIAAPELMLRANDLASEYYMPMQLYLITGVMYFVMAYPLSLCVRWFEYRAGRGQQRI